MRNTMKKDIININEGIVKNFVESLRPEDLEIRKQVDFGYSYNGQVIEIFEIRPAWDNPKEIMHLAFAKLRYTKTKSNWKLYWMRGNLKWDVYEEFPSNITLANVLTVINEDKHGCFFG